MTTGQMGSVSLIWHLGHVGIGADVFAELPWWQGTTANPLDKVQGCSVGNLDGCRTVVGHRCSLGWLSLPSLLPKDNVIRNEREPIMQKAQENFRTVTIELHKQTWWLAFIFLNERSQRQSDQSNAF